ncbi:MAG: biopolymer transporter ExbD [Microscillaceae bacterium]|nr:biopolymer transporter ExbD [Microscillaceae bacterium]MDW8460441.1 biopolymer transporter ExbD [Cytophagales bacterium]
MPKVKVKRKSVSLDMTAMCDVAFLLLTFFMLTTKFKPDEVVTVDTPSSVSDLKIPESNLITLYIAKKGVVYMDFDGQEHRLRTLNAMLDKYKVSMTDEQKREFMLGGAFGMPIAELPAYFGMRKEERNRKEVTERLTGVPSDTTNRGELYDWILTARSFNPKYRIAIKGDQEANYEYAKKVIAVLQEQNVNRFNLITSLEMKPAEMQAREKKKAGGKH